MHNQDSAAYPNTQPEMIHPVRRLISPVCRLTNPATDVISPVSRLYKPVCRLEPDYQSSNAYHYVSENMDYMRSRRTLTLGDAIRGYRTVTASEDCRWMSDFLKDEIFLPGSLNFVESDTSRGKTTFAETVLTSRYHSLLYVTNRRSNKGQVDKRNQNKPGIETISYQNLERSISKNGQFLDSFDAVVFDEFGYILADAMVSGLTCLSVRKILESKKAVKFFLSATMRDAFLYMMDRLKATFGLELVSRCTYYKMHPIPKQVRQVAEIDYEFLIPMIRKSDQKWLVFVRDKRTGTALAEKLGTDVVFIDSESSKQRGIAGKTFEQIIETETYPQKVLICTSVLDSGVNIRDRQLKSIVIESNQKDQIIQMLGRKRFLDEQDFVDLYFLHSSTENLSNDLNEVQRQIREAYGIKANFQQYGWPSILYNDSGPDGIFYRKFIVNDAGQHRFMFNDLALRSLQIIERDLTELLEVPSAFQRKVLWCLGDHASEIPVAITLTEIEQSRVSALHDFLLPYLGIEFEKLGEEAKMIRSRFTKQYSAYFGLDASEHHKKGELLSFDKINKSLEKLGIPMRFQVFYKKKKSFIQLKKEDKRC